MDGVPYNLSIQGNLVREKIDKADDFTQAGERYRSLNKREQKHMASNLVADLSHVIDPAITRRAIENLRQIPIKFILQQKLTITLGFRKKQIHRKIVD